MSTPVNFIVHTLQEVNDGLAHGRYFFMDVARDGIALYESDSTELHEPKPKTPQQALAMAKEYYGEWFPAAMQRFELATLAIERDFQRPAAFDLHQTSEFLYHCVLLVCTFYTPHVHNLGFLRTQAERIHHAGLFDPTYGRAGCYRPVHAIPQHLREWPLVPRTCRSPIVDCPPLIRRYEKPRRGRAPHLCPSDQPHNLSPSRQSACSDGSRRNTVACGRPIRRLDPKP